MSRTIALLSCLVCVWGTAAGQEKSESRAPQRSDFVSDASHFIGTYQPETANHSPEAMAAAGQAFVEALGKDLRGRGALAIDDPERREWTNLPPQPGAGGVRLGELNETQLKATCDLMAALFSKQGYEKFCQIMLGDDQLLPEGRARQGIGTVDFAVMVFGNPSPTEPWAFQLDGHHLGINVSLRGEAVSLSPSFVGAQPEVFEIAGKKYRPFAGELDDAYALIGQLSDDQRIQAVTSSERGEIRTGPGADGKVPQPVGVPCAGFNEDQRKSLLKLISHWVDALPPAQAEKRMKQLSDELDQMHFSWNGEIDPRSPVTYAIQGPTLIIEFSCQGQGNRALDHLHSMYRDPTNEYGLEPRTFDLQRPNQNK